MNLFKFIISANLILFYNIAFSALENSDNLFNNEVTSLYSFSPHTLSQKEIEKKSKLLDIFWKKISNDPNKYKQLLRNELKLNSHSPYFFYDGSKLLLSISNEKEDKILVLKAFQKSDLKDIQNTDYLLTVSKLGIEGFNTTDVAFHILSTPNFKAFIGQHALIVGQDYSFISMLMPINQDFYVDKALKRIKIEQDVTAQRSLLKLLWYSDTPEAIKFLATVSSNTKYNKKIRAFAEKLADESELKETVAKEKLNKLHKALGLNANSTYSQLKALRKKRFNRISDESLTELDQLTFLMKRQRLLEKL